MKIAHSSQLELTAADTAYQLSATSYKVKEVTIVAKGGKVAIGPDNSVDYSTHATLENGASKTFSTAGFQPGDEIDLSEIWFMTDTPLAVVHYWTLD